MMGLLYRSYRFVDVVVREDEQASEEFDFSRYSMMAIQPLGTFIGNVSIFSGTRMLRTLDNQPMTIATSYLYLNPVPAEVAIGGKLQLVLDAAAGTDLTFRIHMKG